MSIKQVYDTTALLSISLIKKLDLLRRLDIVVFVPVSVVEELSDIGKYWDELGEAAKEVIRSGTIEKVELNNEYTSLAERIARFPRVDRGEAEALALSYQINAKELVIDDVDAIGGLVGISKVIGVEIVPSSYILVGAYLKGVLDYDETKSLLKELAAKRGWEQSVLYETAIIMLEEAKKIGS
jgi:predicted nucleic acid-binding protein